MSAPRIPKHERTAITFPSDGLALINGKLWTRSKARKQYLCLRTGNLCAKGTLVYRPMTNDSTRWQRIAATSIEVTP